MTQVVAAIDANEKQIADVFSDKYAFTIPPYQRPYAWEVQQVNELIEDLLEAMDPKSYSQGLYFLGSIVLVKTPNIPDSKVVDGQQRLTTLTILFSVLRDLTENVRTKIKRDEYVKQPADDDRKLPERLRLHLRQRDQAFFAKTVQSEDATQELPRLEGLEGSQARIVENATHLRKRLQDMGEEKRSELISFILNHCYLVVVEVPTDTAARRIFTVLNARGMDLTATDILKADLLERAGEDKEQELSTRWENIELALDRKLFSDLFTHIRMIFQREKPRSALELGFPEFVPSFKQASPENFISDTLEPYADSLELIEDNSKAAKLFGEQTAGLFRALNRLDNKDWVPPLMLRLKLYADSKEDDDIYTFVKKLERLAYYLFITRADVNARMNRYADVMESISPTNDSKLKTAGLKFTKDEKFNLFDHLDGRIYLVTRIIKPLLLRLDMTFTSGSARYDYPIISVEHVCPQTIEEGSQWDDWYKNRDDHDEWLHRLGNLVLLNRRKNSAARNWDLEVKKEKYFAKDDLCPFLLTQQTLQVEEWTPEFLEERQYELIGQFAKTWGLSKSFDKWMDT